MNDSQPAQRSHLGPAIVVVIAVLVDFFTKRIAYASLQPAHIPHDVFGDAVRFTLTFNRGAAFGMHVGEASRWIFALLAVVILGVLVSLYREAGTGETLRRYGLALVAGGAIGNLVDRLRWADGVVDFIDVGVGMTRFWTFNVADSAVTVGTILLLWTMRHELRASPNAPASPTA